MPRPCALCGHARRDEVDAAIRNNEPYQRIAMRFGTSMVSILNHRGHLLGDARSRASEEFARAADVLAQMKRLHANCFMLLELAEGARDLRPVLSAISQVRKDLEALGDLTERLHLELTVRT